MDNLRRQDRFVVNVKMGIGSIIVLEHAISAQFKIQIV